MLPSPPQVEPHRKRSGAKRRPGRRDQKKGPLMKRNVSAWSVLSHSPIAGPRKHGSNVLSAKTGLTKIAPLAFQEYTFVRTVTHVILIEEQGLLD